MAENLQSAIVRTLNPGSKRMVKQAEGIYLMEHIQIPGILVECGFLSNPAEEARLSDAEYQKKLCCVIAVSVADFIQSGYANT
jgi:N-acetylmuramoyl-L-alanine amidase